MQDRQSTVTLSYSHTVHADNKNFVMTKKMTSNGICELPQDRKIAG
jgi:hypothetical protein